MIEHMKWQRTADGIPTFEEVKGKGIGFIRDDDTRFRITELFRQVDHTLLFGSSRNIWYIIIDPPEEEPLEYKGKFPEVYYSDNSAGGKWWLCWETDSGEFHRFIEPSRPAVVSAWNAFVRSIKEEK